MKDIGFQVKVYFIFHQRCNSYLCRYLLSYKMNTSYFKILNTLFKHSKIGVDIHIKIKCSLYNAEYIIYNSW